MLLLISIKVCRIRHVSVLRATGAGNGFTPFVLRFMPLGIGKNRPQGLRPPLRGGAAPPPNTRPGLLQALFGCAIARGPIRDYRWVPPSREMASGWCDALAQPACRCGRNGHRRPGCPDRRHRAFFGAPYSARCRMPRLGSSTGGWAGPPGIFRPHPRGEHFGCPPCRPG